MTLLGFWRAALPELQAYKERMGWTFPYVSTYGSDFAFDFGIALKPEQLAEIDEARQMIEQRPTRSRTGRCRSGRTSSTASPRGPAGSPSR